MQLKIFGFLLALIGQFLILALFLWVFPDTAFYEDAIKWLDFGVVSIVYWLWMLNSIFIRIKSEDETGKVFGALGIRLQGATLYTVFALAFMLITLWIYNSGDDMLSFAWQIGVQAVLLFLFLMSCLMSGKAAEQVKTVYYQEKETKQGKKFVKASLQRALYAAQDNRFPKEAVDRLQTLVNESRYITPSSQPQAEALDIKIEADCDNIIFAASNYQMNEQKITQAIYQLELDFGRRKKC